MSTTSYLAKFGINGTHLGDYVPGFEPIEFTCAECGQDTGDDPDTAPEHADCRIAHAEFYRV
jgi:hypothetical protein